MHRFVGDVLWLDLQEARSYVVYQQASGRDCTFIEIVAVPARSGQLVCTIKVPDPFYSHPKQGESRE